MANDVTADVISYDPHSDEYVIYLIEDGPWPSLDADWRSCLKAIQDRVLDVAESAVDGGLAGKYPDSKGKPIRVQVDSPHGCPTQLEELVAALGRFLLRDEAFRMAIESSPYIRGLRIATGQELGRFHQPLQRDS